MDSTTDIIMREKKETDFFQERKEAKGPRTEDRGPKSEVELRGRALGAEGPGPRKRNRHPTINL